MHLAPPPGSMNDRVERIIRLEADAEKIVADADDLRWQAAELIAAELAAGKSQRQLASDIGKSVMHVNYANKTWIVHLGVQPKPPWNVAYHSPEVRSPERKRQNRKPQQGPSKAVLRDQKVIDAALRLVTKGTGGSAAAVADKLGIPRASFEHAMSYAQGFAARSHGTANSKPRGSAQERRDLASRKPGLANLINKFTQLSVVVEDISVDDFASNALEPWEAAMVYDDLAATAQHIDRLMSGIQGWLEDGDVRAKIVKLKDVRGRTPEEAETALRLADKLQRKLDGRLG